MLNKRPRGRVLLASNDIPADYHADRLRWWTLNSPSWSAHIDADANRGALLAKLAERTKTLARLAVDPAIVDLGCGEGAFLRAFRKIAPQATLRGVDFCSAMLAEARRRSDDSGLMYVLGDMERDDFVAPIRADVVTSILAVDEMDQLVCAFSNIAKILKPGGAAMLVVMDPAKEIERNRNELQDWLNNDAAFNSPILLVKTFPTTALRPVAPYSRIVRPLDQYTTAATSAGLRAEGVEQWEHPVGLGQYSGTLLFDILIFRKTTVL